MSNKLTVRAIWDPEASAWVATSDDVPGLVTEAAKLEQLVEKLRVIIPELLMANGVTADDPMPFIVLSECEAVTVQHAA